MKSLSLAVALCCLLSCGTANKTREQAFWKEVVACAKVDPANVPAREAVLACLVDVATTDYAKCLSALPVALTWTVEELACVCASVR